MMTGRLSRTTAARMSSPSIDRTVRSTSPLMLPVARAARITPASRSTNEIIARSYPSREQKCNTESRVLSKLSGSRRDVEIRKNASSMSRAASRSWVRSEIRRSRLECERSSSSVMSLNALLRAPSSSDELTLLRTERSPAATADDVLASRRIGLANLRAMKLDAPRPSTSAATPSIDSSH